MAYAFVLCKQREIGCGSESFAQFNHCSTCVVYMGDIFDGVQYSGVISVTSERAVSNLHETQNFKDLDYRCLARLSASK